MDSLGGDHEVLVGPHFQESEVSPWLIIIGMALGGVLVLAGTIVGAYAVFRTKREPDESFLQFRQPKGKAFNLKDGFEDAPDSDSVWKDLPPVVERARQRFEEQMAIDKQEEDNA